MREGHRRTRFGAVGRPVVAALASAVFVLPHWTGGGPANAAPQPPPGYNVHLVRETTSGRFWRGGAPREATLAALAEAARRRGVGVTLIDLRTPPTADDRSGRGGRLSPAREAALARRLGLEYRAVSALDPLLPDVLAAALRRGDVYLHCMYGVNRTGFAVARYARAAGLAVSRRGLGARDWRQGERFQARLRGAPAAAGGGAPARR